MTSASTHVSQAAGPMATGSGDQYNFTVLMSEVFERLGTRSRDPRTVAEHDLRWLNQRFVRPRHFMRASKLLREHRTVVLTGQPGNGRRTAALMLLYELTMSGKGMHEIDPGADEDGAVLERGSVGEGDRVWLDLSAGDASYFRQVQPALSSFRAEIEERRAHLVVVVPAHLSAVAPELDALRVTLGRPRADELLMRYLRREQITPSTGDLSAPELSEFLATSPLRDVARLAGLIREASAAAPEGRFGDWLPGALSEVSDSGSATAAFVAELENGRQRALALTAAMFHGCPPDAVHGALAELLKRVGHPEDGRPRLDRSDLTAELDHIKARAVSSSGIRFDHPGRDRAVLTHFWTYFPDLRPAFREWVQDRVATAGLTSDQRRDVISRFAGQTLRCGHPGDLMELARAWTATTPGAQLVTDAVQALAEGLRHDSESRDLRRQILDQAREPGRPSAFRLALTMACSQVMAVSHPDQALVRLHHLARHETTAERRPARDALLDLALGEARLCGLLLGRLAVHGLVPGRTFAPDSAIFLALADRLSTQAPPHHAVPAGERLTACWAAVLRHGTHQQWAPHVLHWLEAARTADEDRDDLLATLAVAGASQPQATARMYVISQRWATAPAPDRPDRQRVADRFRFALDTAQGIGETVTCGAPTEEPAQ
ncbi:hypothetical protein [Streptomyces avicenniae]|uniref:nSTAND3 domain-containing NTPase n=1 Tax=Streptomyces avicenniae TaxID=500153 RepID=UPI00069A9BE0|nr:hypothetical protein [Streptomyces avicenniae]